jgi:formamidopyrimidine-DNA glycosylase
MPELAEVEYFRKRWNPGLGRKVVGVRLNPKARVGRGVDARVLAKALTGAKLLESLAAAKQMAFRFTGGAWLGVHLGMTGRLEAGDAEREPTPYDHFQLTMAGGRELVFVDPRQFGRIQFWQGEGVPPWWAKIPPAILSDAFTPGLVAAFLRRRARTSIKAVLLMQERFPGIGNWMADEVLWRAGFHPEAKAGAFGPKAVRKLYATLRTVCAEAMVVRPPGCLALQSPLAGRWSLSAGEEAAGPRRGRWSHHLLVAHAAGPRRRTPLTFRVAA